MFIAGSNLKDFAIEVKPEVFKNSKGFVVIVIINIIFKIIILETYGRG